MTKPNEAKIRRSPTSVYIPADLRNQLEKLALEIGFKRGKHITSSSLVQYLISEYGEEAKNKLISESKDYQ